MYLDFVCRNAVEGEEKKKLADHPKSIQQTACRDTKLSNIWCAGGRGEPEREASETEEISLRWKKKKKRNALNWESRSRKGDLVSV